MECFPVRYDLTIYKGNSYQKSVRFKKKATGEVYPLTGHIAKAQIRPYKNAPSLIAEIAVTVTEADGLISLALTPEQSAGLQAGVHYYDMYTVKNGKKTTWIYGKFRVEGRGTV